MTTKKIMIKFLMMFVLGTLFAGVGSAAASSILIDGDFTAGEWDGSSVGGDGIVAPGGGGQAFDVEYLGLKLEGDKLYFGLQTGFDLVNGSLGILPGDFALDANGDGVYDYAIDFAINGADEVVFSLYGDPEWVANPYPQHAVSNPFENAGGELLASFEGAFGRHAYDTDRNVDGGLSYVLEGAVDLSLLGGGVGPVGIHWTMGCGNDTLDYTAAGPAPVPEPASLLLLGSGLLGMAALGRRSPRRVRSRGAR